MPDELTGLGEVYKKFAKVGAFSTSVGVKEILEPVLRKGTDAVLPQFTNIVRGNYITVTGFISLGAVGIISGLAGLGIIKILLRSEENQKSNNAKGASEKDKK
jgi:hypothetical protein